MSVTIAIVATSNDESRKAKESTSIPKQLHEMETSLLLKQAPNEPAYLPNSKFYMPGPFVEVDKSSPFFSKIHPTKIDPSIFYIPKVRSNNNKSFNQRKLFGM